MIAHKCDLCKKECGSTDTVIAVKIIRCPAYGKDANIWVKILVGLEKTDSGYGGVPDLCEECKQKIINKFTTK